jgi:hypothetical protein
MPEINSETLFRECPNFIQSGSAADVFQTFVSALEGKSVIVTEANGDVTYGIF